MIVDYKAIERAVMDDRDRPCLYGVMRPCFHPNCLSAHFDTLYEKYNSQPSHGKEGENG